MACYIVPALAWVMHKSIKGKNKVVVDDERQKQLSLLLAGGSIFGLVDHLWNNEFMLVSNNIAKDLILGVTIILTMLGIWAAMILAGGWKEFHEKKIQRRKTEASKL